ncbi:hypothetical protein B0A48_07846 [Cryoendolithus antarcticus]|uniref:Uncharacterized protein n=1 Tax=Cryoendolithus antarcticus TaxID=1507870 RepID=A0A1V8T0J0_9PEZI|nr:hypothetical protein B0A48_07846 [Cryoendolithus antarcticus]
MRGMMFLKLFSRAPRVPKSIDDDDDSDDLEDPLAPQPASIARGPSRWTIFGARGCNIYGYPSSGGILIKKADVLDLLHLSLSRSQAYERSSDPTEEDELCDALRRIGAKWWISKRDWANATMKARESTEEEEEEKVVVYGWPTEGAGVWVLRYEVEDSVPDDFGRLRLALSMEERIAMMREHGAEFAEDASRLRVEGDDLVLPMYLEALQGQFIYSPLFIVP